MNESGASGAPQKSKKNGEMDLAAEGPCQGELPAGHRAPSLEAGRRGPLQREP